MEERLKRHVDSCTDDFLGMGRERVPVTAESTRAAEARRSDVAGKNMPTEAPEKLVPPPCQPN